MRYASCWLLLMCASAVNAQSDIPELMPDIDLLQAGPAWLVGDQVKARGHFYAAAQRGNPLAQYNLAMMMLYREGGPCNILEARVLLRKAETGGVFLARDAIEHMQVRVPTKAGSKQPFPCVLSSQPSRPRSGKQVQPRLHEQFRLSAKVNCRTSWPTATAKQFRSRPGDSTTNFPVRHSSAL